MLPARTILIALLLSVPTVGAAQAPEFLAPTDSVYVTESRSPVVSGFLEFSFPMVGYAWAGDWKRGLDATFGVPLTRRLRPSRT